MGALTAKRVADRERAAQAVELVKRGESYDNIAAQLGYATRGSAWRAVQRLLAAHEVHAVDEMRKVEDMRLDDVLRGIYDAATGGDLGTIDRILRIAERRAKLWGLDAPAKTEISGADGGPLSITIDK